MKMTVHCILAVDKQGGIGRDGHIPWSLPEDMQHFQNMTRNHVVVMGRKTYESLPPAAKPLPHRLNIVVTRQLGQYATASTPNLFFMPMEDVLDYVRNHPEKDVFVIGGAEIYKALICDIDDVILTKIDEDFKCDTRIDLEQLHRLFPWVISTSAIHCDPRTHVRFVFESRSKHTPPA